MNDSELDQLLKLVQTPVPLHAGFRRDVWLRIEAVEADIRKPRVSRLVERFFGWLALPPVAVATCSVMVAAGVWLGFDSGNPAAQGKVDYIQSVSPFAHTHR